MKKSIKLTLEQAREMLGKDETMDALIRANFTEDELNPRVKRWEDLEVIKGWYVTTNSGISESDTRPIDGNQNVFKKKTQAEGVLAMAQLSQLMADVNGEWTPDWEYDTIKYVIWKCGNQTIRSLCTSTADFLAFPTEEIRDQFYDDHIELINEFFKIYQ